MLNKVKVNVVRILSIILLSVLLFYVGFLTGDHYNDRPSGVLPAALMSRLWERDARQSMINELNRENIGHEDAARFLEKNYHKYTPFVFAHPFIILKEQNGEGFRIFFSDSTKSFNNIAGPLIDLRVGSDKSYNTVLFSSPTKLIEGVRRLSDLITVVTFDADTYRMKSVAVNIESQQKGFISFVYRDMNGDGIIDDIIGLTDAGELQHFTPQEFFSMQNK